MTPDYNSNKIRCFEAWHVASRLFHHVNPKPTLPPLRSKEKAPQLVMWGQVRDPAKDYPSEAIQHMQNKPQPTRSAAETKPKTHNIQQPRKC